MDYAAYARDPTDSFHGFTVAAIYCLTQNGKDLSISDDLDFVRSADWANSAAGYGGGKVFTAKNGVKYLFLSQSRRSSFMFLAFDSVEKRYVAF